MSPLWLPRAHRSPFGVQPRNGDAFGLMLQAHLDGPTLDIRTGNGRCALALRVCAVRGTDTPDELGDTEGRLSEVDDFEPPAYLAVLRRRQARGRRRRSTVESMLEAFPDG